MKRVFVIAEAGVNHNGSLALAKRLVRAAKAAGADAVKFQSFRADRLTTATAALASYQKATVKARAQQEMILRLELSEKAHAALAAFCRKSRIEFLSTPFDELSADMLARLVVRRFKIPSGELTHRRLIEHVARKRREIILSTGMGTLAEVRRAVGWIRKISKAPLTVLHCTTEYPAPFAEVNLRAMETMRRALRLPVGYSDHTPGLEASVAAVALGASVIEKHLTLDRRLPGPDHKASLEPGEFSSLVRAIRNVESALGDGIKRPAPSERKNIAVARRSLVAARDLSKGAVLRTADVAIKRPGTGIPPFELSKALGRRLRRAARRDQVLTWSHL